MTRAGIFGWDLPPGVTSRMIDEAAGGSDFCECCGSHVDDCGCPECPACGAQGDERCYPAHGLRYSAAQQVGWFRTIRDHKDRDAADARHAESFHGVPR